MDKFSLTMKMDLLAHEKSNALFGLIDNLEGSEVVISTTSGDIQTFECIGGNIGYISRIDGYEENVILDCDDNKFDINFIKSNKKHINIGDLLELELNNKYNQYLVIQINESIFLYSIIMNNAFNNIEFKKIEEIIQYLEENEINYRIFRKI